MDKEIEKPAVIDKTENEEKFDLKKLRPQFVQEWYTKMGKK